MKSFTITLNWKGEIHKFNVSTYTKAQALYIARKKLAKALSVSMHYVTVYYTRNPNGYEVKEN